MQKCQCHFIVIFFFVGEYCVCVCSFFLYFTVFYLMVFVFLSIGRKSLIISHVQLVTQIKMDIKANALTRKNVLVQPQNPKRWPEIANTNDDYLHETQTLRGFPIHIFIVLVFSFYFFSRSSVALNTVSSNQKKKHCFGGNTMMISWSKRFQSESRKIWGSLQRTKKTIHFMIHLFRSVWYEKHFFKHRFFLSYSIIHTKEIKCKRLIKIFLLSSRSLRVGWVVVFFCVIFYDVTHSLKL